MVHSFLEYGLRSGLTLRLFESLLSEIWVEDPQH